MMERSLEERNKLIEANIKMVWHIAKKLERYAKRQAFAGDLDDLASIGMFGLIRAATNYDESRGVKFSTFAYTYIKHKILEQVKRNGLIRIPEYAHEGGQLQYYRLCCKDESKWIEKCQAAKRAFHVMRLADSTRRNGSRDEDREDTGRSGWNDPPAPEHEDSLVLAEVYETVMTQLKETYRIPIIMHFWDYQKQKDIAEELGLTRQRVNKRINRGIEKLREIYCVGDGEDD